MPTHRDHAAETPSALGVSVISSGGVGEAPTPPAFDEHAFGVSHASTNARTNREAIPVDSRGLRRFAATPGHAPRTTQTPKGSPRERT
jgi:hypothetical protein